MPDGIFSLLQIICLFSKQKHMSRRLPWCWGWRKPYGICCYFSILHPAQKKKSKLMHTSPKSFCLRKGDLHYGRHPRSPVKNRYVCILTVNEQFSISTVARAFKITHSYRHFLHFHSLRRHRVWKNPLTCYYFGSCLRGICNNTISSQLRRRMRRRGNTGSVSGLGHRPWPRQCATVRRRVRLWGVLSRWLRLWWQGSSAVFA